MAGGGTRKVPRLALVEVDVDHHGPAAAVAAAAAEAEDLLHEVVTDKLLVPWVESEPWRHSCLHHAQEAHGGDDDDEEEEG